MLEFVFDMLLTTCCDEEHSSNVGPFENEIHIRCLMMQVGKIFCLCLYAFDVIFISD